MGKLDGRIAIVTGASQGSGYGGARVMAREGASVVLVSRTKAKLESVAREIEAEGGTALVWAADVTDRAAMADMVAATVARFGRIDVLVNAAQSPVIRTAPLAEISDEDVRELWESGAVATLALMREVRPHMIAVGGGSIINFGSGAVHRPAQYGVYGGVKAAIQAISRAAAIEWAKEGIRVNVVFPMSASPAADADFALAEGRAEAVAKGIPLGRVGDPIEDIGPPIAFLASDEARFLTGCTYALDGGSNYLR
ncbi:MAG: SDR family oxidoreductase [Novosphingobium sp.]|nr:SDR family oxidoreductase [Novosphingobium sp.]